MADPAPASKHVSLTNRCAESKSPYVRSHIDNPTAWQLWNPDTIQLAKDTNRLLFVSIGYSACHWCHVMAHESFANPRIAQLLNENFIPVKIDREERPDIDRQYMDFQQATNGGGGWPLNVFVTPDLEPVLSGTYWPGPGTERAQQAGSSFEQVLTSVARVWKEQEQKVRSSGKQVIARLREFAAEGTLNGNDAGMVDDEDDALELDILDEAYLHYKQRYDAKFGGFGGAPKFPTPINLRTLLRLSVHSQAVRDIVGEEECMHAREMVVKTLEAMARGGIKDQIGHGFARYSVTRDWSLPHFEKMLYDNAQLLGLYVEAWQVTRSPLFLDTVLDIADYLTSSPMASSLGGIHAAEDADSYPQEGATEKREGAYYVWTLDELKQILTEQEATVCARYWNVQADGNVDQRFDAQGELIGQNALCVCCEPGEIATELSVSEEEVVAHIKEGRRKLSEWRDANRPRPALDDKIVVSWNGLAISGLAKAAAAIASTLPEKASIYLEAAKKAVTCIGENLYNSSEHTLKRVYREGPGETPGFADDYAFLISGLIDLYETTFDSRYLEFADNLQQTQIKLFWDQERYAFFSTPAGQADILIRVKDAMDNAEPSTNGISASNLFRLGSLLDNASYEKMGKQTISAFEVEIGQHPGLMMGFTSSIVASKFHIRGLIVVGDGPLAAAATKKAHESCRPNTTVLRIGGGAEDAWLKSRNNLVSHLDSSKELVQLCEGVQCYLLDAESIEQRFAVCKQAESAKP